MAVAGAEVVYRDGAAGDDTVVYYPADADAQKEQLVETETGGISQLLEHNNALRRNFDNLKQLHLQLAEANTQLQEAFLRMQAEKARVEGGLMQCGAIQHEKGVLQAEIEILKQKHAMELDVLNKEREEISGRAAELEQRNKSLEKKLSLLKGDNKELNHKLEVVRYGHDVDGSVSHLSSSQVLRLEKDQAVSSKYAIELEYARDLSLVKVDDQNFRQQAADFSHKCKHLEIDLEKAISAGEAVHQQLVALTYEKDATITDLEQALRRLKDDLQGLEKKHRDNERSWQVEKHKLQAILDDKEREEYKLKCTIQGEADQKIKGSSSELVELRTLLSALERFNAAAEAQHVETVKELRKDCDSYRRDLVAALAAQKEASDRLIDLERLRTQLGDALAQNHESVQQIAELRKKRDDLDRKLELLRLELGEAVAVCAKEKVEHACRVENAQRRWAEEKSTLLKREDKLVKAAKKEFSCKYRALKKRSKHTGKVLATMTVDHNQLIVRMRECEAQLAITQTTRFQRHLATVL